MSIFKDIVPYLIVIFLAIILVEMTIALSVIGRIFVVHVVLNDGSNIAFYFYSKKNADKFVENLSHVYKPNTYDYYITKEYVKA